MNSDAFYVTKHQGVLQVKTIGNWVLKIKTRIWIFMFLVYKEKGTIEQENISTMSDRSTGTPPPRVSQKYLVTCSWILNVSI